MSKQWVNIMKNSIISTGGRYSTARMLTDYVNNLYIPLCNLYKTYYTNLNDVAEFESWKKDLYNNWEDIVITQEKDNLDNITIDAGNNIDVKCKVRLPNISIENIEAQVYYGRIQENGVVDDISIIPMKLIEEDRYAKIYTFSAKVQLTNGGNYGYTLE